jgi:hypothetical protein
MMRSRNEVEIEVTGVGSGEEGTGRDGMPL